MQNALARVFAATMGEEQAGGYPPRRAIGDPMEFYATCPAGFEKLLAQELAGLGAGDVRPLKGQVSFTGTAEDAYRACLWSAIASRIVLVLGRFPASSSDELYEGVLDLPWEDHIGTAATLEIEAHGTNAQIRNTKFLALRTKDAISDRLLARRGIRPQTDTLSPDVRAAIRLGRNRASIGIDLTGEPLFRRGYAQVRSQRSPLAPLRPDYAAAMLEAGGWFRAVRHEDPAAAILFSGAGTLGVEAARTALDRAPGLLRPRWGFTGWLGHEETAWARLADEAQQRAAAKQGAPVTLLAADMRAGAAASLSQMLRAAGMPEVEPRTADLRRNPESFFSALGGLQELSCFIDLSWLRPDSMAEEAEALSLAGRCASCLATGTPISALAAGDALDAALGTEPETQESLIVGTEEASLRTYQMGEAPERFEIEVQGTKLPVLLAASDQFAKRLQKVARLRAKWAKREGIGCYRIYDADLPDYVVSIELYEGAGTPGRWLQISEYAAPKDIDPALARKRLLDVLTLAPRILKVAPADTYLKVRTRAKGGSQYADEASRGAFSPKRGPRRDGSVPLPKGAHLIEEGGLVFEVNFSNRLDCGIFLDHRDTRSMIRELAKGTQGSKRFLNLFAYTGTATCYAADGGMRHTTTVDMSRPSLEWARRNMERNGFCGPEHEYVQADILSWVQDQRHSRNRWDLIFCDVPTFSNSSRMHGSWDVQRDHAELLITVSRLLTQNGICVFSCNLRSFRPDEETLAKAGVEIEDITAKTIPEDFARNPKIHHCYLVKRTPRPEGEEEAAAPRNARPAKGRPARTHAAEPRQGGPRNGQSQSRGQQGSSRPHGTQTGFHGREGQDAPQRRRRDEGDGPRHRSPYSAFY